MASPVPNPTQEEQAPRDTTFRKYSSEQAATYAKGRIGYSRDVIAFIVSHHRATGGGTGCLVDVGCGPGLATRALAASFDVVIGADPGEAMLKTATELGGTTATGAPIQYKLSTAEDLDKIEGLGHGSVDMITAAASVHWFDMPKFWAAAAKILKPGGSVMVWTRKILGDENGATPEGSKIGKVLKHFNEDVMAPYLSEGNRLSNSGYEGLPMPWDEPALEGLFDRDAFLRREFFVDAAQREALAQIAMSMGRTPLEGLRAVLETLGSVTRWREAHPDLVGTPQDCLNVVMAELEEALRGVDKKAEIVAIMQAVSTVLICVKKAKAAEA